MRTVSRLAVPCAAVVESRRFYGQSDPSASFVSQTVGSFRKHIPDVHAFYFNGSKTCRLCQELALHPEGHLQTARHACREALVDVLIPWAGDPRRPRTAEDFAARLLASDHRSMLRAKRIPALVPPTYADRCRSLGQQLLMLRDLGVLRFGTFSTLAPGAAPPGGRGLGFERLECIGDSAWSRHTAVRLLKLFPHADWIKGSASAAGGYQLLRDFIEGTENLEKAFDLLDPVATFLKDRPNVIGQDAAVMGGKFKADVMECLIGELSVFRWSVAPGQQGIARHIVPHGVHASTVLSLVEHCLEELLDVIALTMVATFSRDVDPVVREAAALKHFGRPSGGTWRPQDMKRAFPVSHKMARHKYMTYTIPRLSLHSEPQPLSSTALRAAERERLRAMRAKGFREVTMSPLRPVIASELRQRSNVASLAGLGRSIAYPSSTDLPPAFARRWRWLDTPEDSAPMAAAGDCDGELRTIPVARHAHEATCSVTDLGRCVGADDWHVAPRCLSAPSEQRPRTEQWLQPWLSVAPQRPPCPAARASAR